MGANNCYSFSIEVNFCDKFFEFHNFGKFRENTFSRISRIIFKFVKFAKISFRGNFCHKDLWTRTFLPLRCCKLDILCQRRYFTSQTTGDSIIFRKSSLWVKVFGVVIENMSGKLARDAVSGQTAFTFTAGYVCIV